MSSDLQPGPFAIEARNLGKRYSLYERPADRLKQLLWGRWRRYDREFWALRDIDLSIRPGEVIGVVGRNGAGKSTLLQLVCGTLPPTTGQLHVRGRVAALLELGAGFNPEFTGIENIHMNAAILGLGRREVDERLDDILAFADIGDFVKQPVKTYSSGMFMRLAFAVATAVEPDILVIDEALSVGDGAFARKSFDRIMKLRDAGKTILFCSHSMYQVEALCAKAMWIEAGALKMFGTSAEVTSAYQASLNAAVVPSELPDAVSAPTAPVGGGRIVKVSASADGESGNNLHLRCGESDLSITIEFSIDPHLPTPAVALGISDSNALTVASATSHNDGVTLHTDAAGHGSATIVFPQFPLLKGQYSVTCFLMSEDGIHPYEQIERCIVLHVTQKGLEQGLVTLPHEWLP